MEQKEKLHPKDDGKSRMKLLERFDWTDRLLTETEKQAVEDFLVEYHDIFARHGIDIGTKTESFTAKAYQCRSTWEKI